MVVLYFGQTLMNNHKLVIIFIFAFLKHDKNAILSFLKIYMKNLWDLAVCSKNKKN